MLEKSPSSLLRMRFLQSLYPDAHFVVILRHPVCNAYATHSWALEHGGKNALSPDAVAGFVEHWVHAHRMLEQDLPHLRNVRLVHLETLVASPQQVIDAVCADLGLPSHPLPEKRSVRGDVNRKYAREFERESHATQQAIRQHAASFPKFGYSIDLLDQVTATAPSLLGVPTGLTPAAPQSAGKEAPGAGKRAGD